MRIAIKVIPNAKTFKIVNKQGKVYVYVDEKPEKGKANKRLIKMLKKILGEEVKIVKGMKSSKKIIEIKEVEKWEKHILTQ